jgi:hypothetical protein
MGWSAAPLFAALAFVSGTAPTVAAPAASRCRAVPAGVQKVLTSALAFPNGGELKYARRVASLKRKSVYFVSGYITSPDLGQKRVLATWVTNRLDSTGTMASLNAGAKAYSDLQPSAKAFANVTMATEGARVSQRCAAVAAQG